MQQSIVTLRGLLRLSLAPVLLALPALASAQASPDTGAALPNGLSSADWASIRAAHEAGRHAVHAVQDGYRARNPRQQWQTHFDGRGFTAQPDSGAWTWGLELQSYGFAGAERATAQPAGVSTQGTRLAYDWDDTLQEWYLNDARGLEHGFTVRQRPPSSPGAEPVGPLSLTLAVRGEWTAQVLAGGREVGFQDAAGQTAVSYSQLVVFDADGQTLPAHFESLPGALRLCVDESGARYPLTIDPIAQQARLEASNPDASDRFGFSVAVSGDTVLVGATDEDSSATGVNGNESDNSATSAGAAYVFVRSGTTWSQQAYLKASNAESQDRFGTSVALSGDTAVIGATGEDSSATGVNGNESDNSAFSSGAAYVFVRSGTTWSQEAYVKASNTDSSDSFGQALSVSGDTLVVGAFAENGGASGVNGNDADNSVFGAGAAYVFVRSGTVWSQQAYLKASNTGSGDFFGMSVSVDGDTVAVGAVNEDSNATGIDGDESNNSTSNAGAGYVFVRSGTVWSQEAYLKASNTGVDDGFGIAMALSGDTLVAGANLEDSNATGVDGNESDNSADNAGAAYVFVRSGSAWSQQAYLKASNTDAGDQFGRALAVSGDRAVVGAPSESSNATWVNGNQSDNSAASAGAAYLFERSGSTWSQQAYLKGTNTAAGDDFGFAVSASGDTLVVGARDDSGGASNSGAAYVFALGALYTPYCTQAKATSVAGCSATLSLTDASLAMGSWDTTNIPRSGTLASAGTTFGIYIYSDTLVGQSAFATTNAFGTLCLPGFKRSFPACAPLVIAHPGWTSGSGACTTSVASLDVDCSSGALGLSVGDDLNVQFWYRDPIASDGGNANFSNAIFYTLL